MQNAPEHTSEHLKPQNFLGGGGGGMPPDPLEVVGPESPPGARVTQNSRYVTDGLEMLMASSSRMIAITSLQVWLSLHLILAVQRQRQEFRKFRNTDRITPVYLTTHTLPYIMSMS